MRRSFAGFFSSLHGKRIYTICIYAYIHTYIHTYIYIYIYMGKRGGEEGKGNHPRSIVMRDKSSIDSHQKRKARKRGRMKKKSVIGEDRRFTQDLHE